jgi:hypothetical protein
MTGYTGNWRFTLTNTISKADYGIKNPYQKKLSAASHGFSDIPCYDCGQLFCHQYYCAQAAYKGRR